MSSCRSALDTVTQGCQDCCTQICPEVTEERKRNLFETVCYLIGWIAASIIPFIDRPAAPYDAQAELDGTPQTLRKYNPMYEDGKQPSVITVGTKTRENIEVTAVNGANVADDRILVHAKHLSKLLYKKGKARQKITFIRNPTQGVVADTYRYCMETSGSRITPSVELLRDTWKAKLRDPNKKIIHIAHSEGAAITRLALYCLTKEERQRIRVIAIAPGAYIPDELCNKVQHVVSILDPVPWFDWYGRMNCSEDSVKYIVPNILPDKFDHSIYSASYRSHIKKHFQQFLKEW